MVGSKSVEVKRVGADVQAADQQNRRSVNGKLGGSRVDGRRVAGPTRKQLSAAATAL